MFELLTEGLRSSLVCAVSVTGAMLSNSAAERLKLVREAIVLRFMTFGHGYDKQSAPDAGMRASNSDAAL